MINDTELLLNLRTGKKLNESINFLYTEYFNCLMAYVLKNHGNRQDAEDIFQEVIIAFIDLLKKNKFREESGVKTLLYAINRHLWLNELKKRGLALLREEKFTEQQERFTEDPVDLANHKQSRQEVKQLLKRLGRTCEKLLVLYYYEGLSAREIKSYFEYSNEQVIKSKLCKCQKQLDHLIHETPHLKKQLRNLLEEDLQHAV